MVALGRQLLCVLALIHFGAAQRSGSRAQSRPATPNRGKITNIAGPLPDENVCGKRITRFKRIINGTDSNLEFPWITAIGYTTTGRPKPLWLCAGSLITDRHVMTAASCNGLQGYVMSIARLGDLDLNDKVQDNATPVDYLVDRVVQHPRFNRSTSQNNIAIVRLKSVVTYSKFIRPICLTTDETFRRKNYTAYYADVVGWGRTEADRVLPSRQQKAAVRVWDQKECQEKYQMLKRVVDNNMVCAGGEKKHACYGDQGGPLMVRYAPAWRGTRVSYYLYGIVSHGERCGITGYPGVYTRVTEFMNWILQNLS